jgi:putative peptide zinc metalloprotease protein
MDKDNTDNNVAAPVNVSQSINYDCVNCMTYSVAEQVFITLDKPLTPQQKIQLAVIWLEMQVYQREVEAGLIPPDQIPGDLDKFTERIVKVVEPNIATTNAPSPTSSQSVSESVSQSPEPSAAVAPAPTQDASVPSGSTSGGTSSGGTTGGATTEVQPAPTADSSGGSTSDGSTSGGTSGGDTSGGTTSAP